MMTPERRRFLKYLAASPLVARAWGQSPAAAVLANPKDALDLMDFEEAARKALPPSHWGYMATGVDDDLTLKANRAGFGHYQLRPRRLVDVSKTDLRVNVFGSTWDSPIFLCPVGSQRAFHAQGELATARASQSQKVMQILSTVTSVAVEDVAKARGAAPWYQLYMPNSWSDTEKVVKRVEDAGCPALAWTVDLLGGRNTETMERFKRADTRDCSSCHPNGMSAANVGGGTSSSNRPMFKGIDPAMNPPFATWAYVDRLKKLTKMKLLLKGLDSGEDAKLAVEHGVDGIIVSNHGGRSTETLRSTIEALPEVVDAVAGRVPVFVDGGFRRGTDVYKALALGARAVGIGRPYIWGLSAFGQEGVERVVELLRAELTMTMKQCGTPAIAQISRAIVMRDGVRF
jgi:isopentenyl diphosphate isomerase/L-lactate dehydrogenase-like FMN-dependent dehydrogenase